MQSLSDALPDELNFDKDPDASSERMNRAMAWILAQLRAALSQRNEYQDALDGLQKLGLQRLADALAPVVLLAQQQEAAIKAVFDEWVAGNGLVDLHLTITAETDGKVADLQGKIDGLGRRADDSVAAIAALEARLTGDRWYQNHG